MVKKDNLFFTLTKKVAESILIDNFENLSMYALMIVKPETFVFDKMEIVLSLIEKYRFEIVYYKFTTINSSQVIELWKNSWDNISLERVLINQKNLKKIIF